MEKDILQKYNIFNIDALKLDQESKTSSGKDYINKMNLKLYA